MLKYKEGSWRGIYLAVLAGLSAAFASVFAKTAVSEDGAHSVASVLSTLTKSLSIDLHRHLFAQSVIVWTLLAIRGIGVAGILMSNAAMWIFFSKSLQLCSSSIVATVTNTSANFFFTACASWLLFNEKLPGLWWFGLSLILCGLLLVHHGSQERPDPGGKKTI